MSSFFSTPYIFAVALYASALMLVLLVVFGLAGKARGSRFSAVGLVLSACVLALSLFSGDWRIPDCHDAQGNLISEMPQCRFPF